MRTGGRTAERARTLPWRTSILNEQCEQAGDDDLAVRGVLPRCLASIVATGPRITKAPGLPRSGPPAQIPWRDRLQAKQEAKAKASRVQEQWDKPRELLVGVVLHLAALRMRYMAALAARRQQWQEQQVAGKPAAPRRRPGSAQGPRPLAAPSLRPPRTQAATAAAAAMAKLSEAPKAYPTRSAPLF